MSENAPKVKVIQVRKKTTSSTAGTPEAKKELLKVAAYCRVSTEHEEQESS